MIDLPNIQRSSPLSVTQLTNAIKMSLESTFPLIHLQGEISNLRPNVSGHLYFTLKDENAQINAVMFKGDASLVKVAPKGGDQVVIKGELTVYPPKGNYQLVVRTLSYVGLGELLLKLEQLKVKLHQLGWFKSSRKKQLPSFPKIIGVITSPTGAVIQDILNVLSRRFSGFHLILNPVKVQGEGAAQEIAQAIEQFNQHQLVDVIIVGRGGGSLEDLWAFNEEIVASAIYQSTIPIISAVGHETDHCIADYVADARAPTPSAAAEIVIAEKNQHLKNLHILHQRILQTIKHLVQQNQLYLKGFVKHPLLSHPFSIIEMRMQKLDDMRIDLEQAIDQFIQYKKRLLELKAQQIAILKPLHQIEQNKQKLAYATQQLHHLWQAKQAQRRQAFNSDRLKRELLQNLQEYLFIQRKKLTHCFELLRAVDPKNLMKKGYSILFEEKKPVVINSITQLNEEQNVRLLLSDGEAYMTIKKVISLEANANF